MNPDRFLPTERPNDLDVQREGGKPLHASYDVRDLHFMIIDDRTEMVGWQTIGFEQNIVIQVSIFGDDIAPHMIMCDRGSFVRHLETDDVLFTTGNWSHSL